MPTKGKIFQFYFTPKIIDQMNRWKLKLDDVVHRKLDQEKETNIEKIIKNPRISGSDKQKIIENHESRAKMTDWSLSYTDWENQTVQKLCCLRKYLVELWIWLNELNKLTIELICIDKMSGERDIKIEDIS